MRIVLAHLGDCVQEQVNTYRLEDLEDSDEFQQIVRFLEAGEVGRAVEL